MREARLILPSEANRHIEGQLEAQLVSAFGGFTVTLGYGAWNGGGGTIIREPIDVYDIAMDDCGANILSLEKIVDWLFTVTDERAIYYRYPDGDVLIRGCPLDTPTRATI